MIRKSILVLCLGLVATAPLFAANKEQKRLHNAGVVMHEIMNVPDNIPQAVIEKAECVIVFPSVLKAAFIVGASYGRGAMVAGRGRISGDRGARPQCMRLRAEALDFKSADKRPTSFC